MMMASLRGYKKDWLRSDLLAGLTTSAVVIPKAMAFALVAGLPAVAGLYVAFVPMLVYALLGTSRQLSVSSTTTLAILTASSLAQAVPGGEPERMLAAAATLAALTGAFLLAAGVCRLGFLANFLSDPVLTGFKAGIGLVIIADQLPKLLGVHIDKGGFIHNLVSLGQHLPQAHLPTMVLAAAALVLIFGLEHVLPRTPAPLVAAVLGIAAAGLLAIGESGVALTGTVQSGLPVSRVPDWTLLATLWPGALGIALMSFTESIAAGRAFARQDDPRPDANRELRALGAANIVGSFFGCFPAGGGTSQTAVNAKSGARSQVSGVVTVAVVVAVMLFLSGPISLLPLAVLAAIVVATTIPLLSPAGFRAILRVRRIEFVWALAAAAGVVFLGMLPGILVAIAISVLTLLYQGTHPPVYAVGRRPGSDGFSPLVPGEPGEPLAPGLLVLRTEGRMNFASAPRVGEHMWSLVAENRPRVVVLECSAVPDIEYTALRSLTAGAEKLKSSEIELWLAGLNPSARHMVEHSPLLGAARVFPDLRAAVAAYESGRTRA